MKNLFFWTATVVLIIFTSCSKQTDEIYRFNEGSIASISFIEEAPSTRAFFGTTVAAETWEQTINTMTLLVYNSSGNLLIRRAFSSAEIAAKKATFAIPGVTAGATCDFYVVANLPVSDFSTKLILLAWLESNAGDYNGTFAEVTQKSKRTSCFIMSGSASQAIAAAGTTTNVAITLKRTVAKIAVEISTTNNFQTLYGGTIRVNSVTIKKAASQALVFKGSAPNTGAMTFSHTQASNVSSTKYQNLFYVYENGVIGAGNRVVLEINATYDRDRNFSTTEDQLPVTYTVELEGSSAGNIIRNGYYRVAVNLDGLAGSDATLLITAAAWETPITQTITIGK